MVLSSVIADEVVDERLLMLELLEVSVVISDIAPILFTFEYKRFLISLCASPCAFDL